MKKIFALSLTSALMVAVLGCGPKTPDGMPELQPTTVTIILDGAPCPDATLNLKPLDSANKWTSGGRTTENGVATLVTHGQYKGVPVGKYKVSISKKIGEGTPPPPSPIDAESARIYKEYQESGATYEEFNVIAKEYGIVESTPAEIEIVKGKNDLKIDVGTSVHEPVNSGHGVL